MASHMADQNVDVYLVDLTSIMSTWYNQTEHQLKQVLRHLETLANAIVFIDEIDSFVGETNRRDVHRAPLLTEFLQWINGIATTGNNLTLMCATNFMDACDSAFLSRCTMKIEIPSPSQKIRLEWWNATAQQLSLAHRDKLSHFEVVSFRSLEQIVEQAEETVAYNFQRPPCYADYYALLQEETAKNRSHINYGGRNSSGPIAATKTPEGQVLSILQQPLDSPSQTMQIDERILACILDQAKSIAASTAAMTVATMNVEKQKRHGMAENSNTEETVTSSQPNQVEDEDSVDFEDANQVEDDDIIEFEDVTPQTLSSSRHRSPISVTNTTAHDKEIAQSLVKHDEALEVFESRLEKLESAILLKSGVQQLGLHVDEEILALKEKMDELRNWDTVTVTWNIEQVEKSLLSVEKDITNVYSRTFNVGQYTMQLRVHIPAVSAGTKMTDDCQQVGIYLSHCKGFDWTLIQVGKSELSLVGIRNADTITERFSDDSAIEQVGSGRGWRDFIPMKDLKEKYVKNDKLTIKAKVRVKRMIDVVVGSS